MHLVLRKILSRHLVFFLRIRRPNSSDPAAIRKSFDVPWKRELLSQHHVLRCPRGEDITVNALPIPSLGSNALQSIPSSSGLCTSTLRVPNLAFTRSLGMLKQY